MEQPKRALTHVRNVPWAEFRRRATVVYLWLQAGWTALTPAEREEATRLITKSKGRPKNLSRTEARRLGRLAAKAGSAAAARSRTPGTG
jgi:hypothetical protein